MDPLPLVRHFCFDIGIRHLVDHAQITMRKSISISLTVVRPEILEELVGEPGELLALQFLQPCKEASLISRGSGCCRPIRLYHLYH